MLSRNLEGSRFDTWSVASVLKSVQGELERVLQLEIGEVGWIFVF